MSDKVGKVKVVSVMSSYSRFEVVKLGLTFFFLLGKVYWVAVISAKNHKRQSVTAKREKS